MDSQSFLDSAFNHAELIEELYNQYRISPDQVDPTWKKLFDELDGALETSGERLPQPTGSTPSSDLSHREWRISKLITAYRSYGHLFAKVNCLQIEELQEPWQLNLSGLGFSIEELDLLFPTCGLKEEQEAPLKEIIAQLQETYCGNIGVEYMGIQNPELQKWLQQEIEPSKFTVKLSIDQKRMILQHLNKSELFESFLHTKYVGQKRFSLEGGETLIPILAGLIEVGADLGLLQFDIGMAHRGRLNVLSNILDKSYSQIFSEFEDRWLPNTFEGSGDVKYHKGFSSHIVTESGKRVEVVLAPNPSHLEAVNPVVEGQVRAKQILLNSKEAKSQVVPILIHGDAAIAGQGIVYETMQMYDLEGFSTGGTIHVVINNQIGFTALPEEGRSTLYCTDIARAFNAPVFHVNAEDPESCIYATMLAVQIRQKFQCDVFIDLNCYRKYGHNEADEPAFTQPVEYQVIRKKKPIREIYRDNLIQQGILERHMAEALEEEFKAALQEALQGTRYPEDEEKVEKPVELSDDQEAEGLAEMLRPVVTKVEFEELKKVGIAIATVPEEFNLHRKLKQLNKDRATMAQGKKALDWGMGELLAYGSLLNEGVNVRLSGQDCGRGTFSHRHARFMDQEEKHAYYPLQHIDSIQGRLDVINSFLSEYGVLGFEYGYSLTMPESLVLWEAQFGDFANGAQVIIDQFISSSEQKWGQKNSLVLLLPHGYEGQGPEHSSGRVERFLTLSADNNWFVANVTTPAQLFHLLRRQVLRRSPKPLIIFTPKALLRHPQCVSPLKEFSEGSFEEVIDDTVTPSSVKKVVFCSGKVYYDALQEREKRGNSSIAIIRLEQLYPLHKEKLAAIIKRYPQVKEYVWLQEEPQNFGSWHYIAPFIEELLPKGKRLRFIGRTRSAASATGSVTRHKQEYQQFMDAL